MKKVAGIAAAAGVTMTTPLLDEYRNVIHRCPRTGEGLTPCCGKTPFELPRHDRLAVNDDDVTCPESTVDEPALEAEQHGGPQHSTESTP